jgi:hypothetical protein
MSPRKSFTAAPRRAVRGEDGIMFRVIRGIDSRSLWSPVSVVRVDWIVKPARVVDVEVAAIVARRRSHGDRDPKCPLTASAIRSHAIMKGGIRRNNERWGCVGWCWVGGDRVTDHHEFDRGGTCVMAGDSSPRAIEASTSKPVVRLRASTRTAAAFQDSKIYFKSTLGRLSPSSRNDKSA